jgi:structural maintenance of chromosome 1
LFRIEEGLEKDAEDITTLVTSLAGLREEKDGRDEELEQARTDQAKARAAVARAEKRIKKAEKTLEDKASTVSPAIRDCLGLLFPPQKPELVTVEASIAHSTRKLNNAQKLQEQVSKEVEKQTTKVQGYQRDLETVQKAAEEAQGK